MNTSSNKLLLCSTLNSIKKAKVHGKLNLEPLYLINIINKYLDDKCNNLDYEDIRKLKELVVNIKNKNNIFYNEKNLKSYKNIKYCKNCNDTNIYNIPLPVKPTVDDATIELDSNVYNFKYEDFTTNFNSPDNSLPKFVKLESLPLTGVIKFDNEIITDPYTFDINNIDKLIFDLEGAVGPVILNFNFQTSNNSTNITFSNMANFTINVDAQVNQPPTDVGDNNITIQYSSTRIFTRADFTSNTTPPYNDPEGDAAADLRITSLPLVGVLKHNGTPVTISQIIPFSEIDSGLLIYESDITDQDGYNTNFTFEIADEGSNTFVG